MTPFSQSVIERIDSHIEQKQLLQHGFYKAWSRGELNQECLQEYAKDYYHHVKAFPTYLSAIHSREEDPETRKVLLQNLIEEEAGSPNHPDLWKQFITALKVAEADLQNHTPSPAISSLISLFRDICQKNSTPCAIASLYAYESQIPAICKAKIDGLRCHYGMKKKSDWEYFSVHIQADIEHARQERALLEKSITPSNYLEVESSVHKVLDSLNAFLTTLAKKYAIC